ncbi:MAG: anaerobic ribonucleoside-triphosphate reductase activating protein [Planctomycetota bacterium]
MERAAAVPTDLDYPVSGFTPLTGLDWPGNLCATLFVSSCPWDCPFCHNKSLRSLRDLRPWAELAPDLEQRVGFIEGVVFSGGEPTLYEGLESAVRFVKSIGLKAALHTGGALPEKLERVLATGLVDWVGMDFKAPLERYDSVTMSKGSAAAFERSLSILLASGVDHEIRTTLFAGVANFEVLITMARQLEERGARKWMLQQCREGGLEGGFTMTPPRETINRWAATITSMTSLEVRGR